MLNTPRPGFVLVLVVASVAVVSAADTTCIDRRPLEKFTGSIIPRADTLRQRLQQPPKISQNGTSLMYYRVSFCGEFVRFHATLDRLGGISETYSAKSGMLISAQPSSDHLVLCGPEGRSFRSTVYGEPPSLEECRSYGSPAAKAKWWGEAATKLLDQGNLDELERYVAGLAVKVPDRR